MLFENLGKKIQNWAKFFAILGIIGNIITIIWAVVNLSKVAKYSPSAVFVIFLVVTFGTAISVAITIFLCQLLSGFGVIVESHEKQLLAPYTQRVSQNPPVSPIYTVSQPSVNNTGIPTGQPGNQNTGHWYCPVCGKKNENYVGTCGCGQRKP